MILPIRLYLDPILKKVCSPVADFTDSALETLIQDMIETMQANNGVGLAANQVGVDRSVTVLHVENKTKILVLINPKLIAYSKKREMLNEACLSCPGLSVPIKRPKSLIVDANTPTGELIRYEFSGFDARIMTHELDHTQGLTLARAVQNFSGLL